MGGRGGPQGAEGLSKVVAGVRAGPGEKPDAASRQHCLGRELYVENSAISIPNAGVPHPTLPFLGRHLRQGLCLLMPPLSTVTLVLGSGTTT